MFHIDDTNQQQEEDGKSRITVSKQFKDKVVKPILKVKLIIEKIIFVMFLFIETFSSG
jgi:hypothetical protein